MKQWILLLLALALSSIQAAPATQTREGIVYADLEGFARDIGANYSSPLTGVYRIYKTPAQDLLLTTGSSEVNFGTVRYRFQGAAFLDGGKAYASWDDLRSLFQIVVQIPAPVVSVVPVAPISTPLVATAPQRSLYGRDLAWSGFYQSRASSTSVNEVTLGGEVFPLSSVWILGGTLEAAANSPRASTPLPTRILSPLSSGQKMFNGWTYVWATTEEGADALVSFHPDYALVNVFIFDARLERRDLELASNRSGLFYANDGRMYRGTPGTVAQVYTGNVATAPVGTVHTFETSNARSALRLYLAQTFAPPVSTPVVTPPAASSSNGGMCWVNGYTRKNGTRVAGYYRRC